MEKPAIVFLLFREGKLVITGGKNRRMMNRALKIFYTNVLLPYRDTSEIVNYVQTSVQHHNLAEVFSKVIEEFGDGSKPEEREEDDEDEPLAPDLRRAALDMDRYEALYQKRA